MHVISFVQSRIGSPQYEANHLEALICRTYLKLPWRPLISVDGTTVYDLDNQFRIVKHVESWSVSPLEAIGQIFTPSSGRSI
ncbi:hypothetical protein HanPSC8_Chr06g0244151 [Helianthus annuus]|nr:hypothetical protein HanPSC8_Chr06g0244151 [Helianthus annuus]